MKIISHRGNLYGPSPETENDQYQIYKALELGFDVEVDLWLKGGKYYIGHDSPDNLVSIDFIKAISPYAWFHCKNLDALYDMSTNFPKFNYFWHESDKFTLTSKGFIWTYPGQEITDNSIIVLKGDEGIEDIPGKPYGICTDYAVRMHLTKRNCF